MRKELLVPIASGLGNGFRVDKRVINVLGPMTAATLLPGEKVAVTTRRVLSRKGRCVVRVRLFGESSLGWLDTALLWGACVEVFVCQGGIVKHLVELLYPDVHIAPLAESLTMPPNREWDGVLIATISTKSEADHLRRLVERWGPLVVIIAAHPKKISKASFDKWTSYQDLRYTHSNKYICRHIDFGGVTSSDWRMRVVTTRMDEPLSLELTGMTASFYIQGTYKRHWATLSVQRHVRTSVLIWSEGHRGWVTVYP